MSSRMNQNIYNGIWLLKCLKKLNRSILNMKSYVQAKLLENAYTSTKN